MVPSARPAQRVAISLLAATGSGACIVEVTIQYPTSVRCRLLMLTSQSHGQAFHGTRNQCRRY
jgi:hypothetical protein